LITLEFPPKRGGAGTYCNELSYAGGALGLNLKIWAPKNSNSVEKCKFVELPFKGSQGWLCSLRLILILRRKIGSNDILHLAEPAALLAFIRFGWLIKENPKLIITIHGSELLKFGRNPVSRKLFSKVMKKASKIHVLSNHNLQKVFQRFPLLTTDRVIQLAVGVPRALVKDPIKSGPNLKQSQVQLITILCVGRIHPRKGQLELLEAIYNLPKQSKLKILCKFIGPFTHSSYAVKVRNYGRAVGCEVNFLGDLSDEQLYTHYASADLFALTPILCPKSVEGFGFVYLEASSHGLPVIGHRVGGIEDAIKDGHTGFLAEPSDRKSLTDILEKLISNRALRDQLGNNGKKWAQEHCWSRTAKEIYLGN
jgi:phosphatidylinositol alpha-1,6-mannosyltransferase